MRVYRPWGFLLLPFLYAAPVPVVVDVARAADPAIGFVNVPAIMEQAPQARAARERLQREFSGRRKDIETCSREIEEIDQTLRSEGRNMGKSKRDRLIERIQDVRRDCDRLKEDFDADFNRRRREELLELEQKITGVINRIAKEKNFKLIVGPPVVYVDERMNLTKEVLDALSRDVR
jgi:outer membrane protein